MIPILYPANETEYTSHGIGSIPDAESCLVTEGDDTRYELRMTVPVTTRHFSEILPRCQILAKPNPYDRPQPFRITRITKPLRGLVSIYAEHVSYDTVGIPVTPFSAEDAAEAVNKINLLAVGGAPFVLSTDIEAEGSMKVTVPTAYRSLLGGKGLQAVYGGDYQFDRYQIRLLAHRGENRGFRILYGKNMVDLEQEQNISEVYTGVLPYWANNEDLVQGSVQAAPGTYDFSRVKPLDVTRQFKERPTVEQVNAAGAAWAAENKIGIPEVSIKASFVPPGSTGLDQLEELHLFDTVTVRYARLGVETEASVIETEFDVLRERYTSVRIGDRRASIAQTIAAMAEQMADAPTLSAMQQAIKNATDLITGAAGGSVVWGFDSVSGLPNELYFLDTDSTETATNVLRINRNGIGFSTQGLAGPFDTAWTIDGSFYAKFITAGKIVTNQLEDLSVTNAKVANNNLTNGKLYDNTVQTGKLADSIGTSLGYADTAHQIFTGAATATQLKVSEIVDGEGRSYHMEPIGYKDANGATNYMKVWVTRAEW